MSERAQITVGTQAFEDLGGDENFSVPLKSAIEQLQRALNSIPPEFQEDAEFYVWGSGDYVSVYPEVRYRRPETDDELRAKQARHEQYRLESERQERAHFEYLKKKFGGD